MTLIEYLRSAGYDTIPPDYYTHVREWMAWYRGKVKDFHQYTLYSAGHPMRRTRASLNMAKQGAEYWASLLWNNECSVNLDKAASDDKLVNDALKENDFWRQTANLVERAFAGGTGAFVVYDVGGKALIEYLPVDFVIPLAWRGDKVASCAFGAERMTGEKVTDRKSVV